MWCEPKGIVKICPECSCPVYINSINRTNSKCKMCNIVKTYFRCTNVECRFQSEICVKCLTYESSQEKINSQAKQDDGKCSLYILTPVVLALLAVSLVLYLKNSPKSQDFPNARLLERLRHRFPSQKNETWYHILSVLEQEVPTVKSITLLHRNDRKTSDCLATELVNIFDGGVKLGEVRFHLEGVKYKDYGEVLKHYHAVVKKFRVLVTNLSAVPANIAKIFHSLCDEVSSDIKPSLFVFTLGWDERVENLRPLEKATTILKQAWSDLPQSEVFPLLSRVVKNVVDVIPETQLVC